MPDGNAPNNVERIKKQVAARYPEMADVEPTLVTRQSPASPDVYKKLKLPQPHDIVLERSQYIYVFKKTVQTTDGAYFQRIVRAVVSKEGKLIRTTSSK
jgi:hypothetical protein